MIDLVDQGLPDLVRQAVWSCYQESPTPFRDYLLWDPGAYPEPPLSGKITWNIRRPGREPVDAEGRARVERARALVERIRQSVEERRRRQG